MAVNFNGMPRKKDSLCSFRVVIPQEIAQLFKNVDLVVAKFHRYFNEISRPKLIVKQFKEASKYHEEAEIYVLLYTYSSFLLEVSFYYLSDNTRSSCTWWKKAYNSPIFTFRCYLLIRTKINILPSPM